MTSSDSSFSEHRTLLRPLIPLESLSWRERKRERQTKWEARRSDPALSVSLFP
ncbi:hypothetical protein FKM82_015352 [Ascaphus truei]